jgi:hypothetical protein
MVNRADSEDGRDMFLWNIGWLPTDYLALDSWTSLMSTS